jgi:hypothetical protein
MKAPKVGISDHFGITWTSATQPIFETVSEQFLSTREPTSSGDSGPIFIPEGSYVSAVKGAEEIRDPKFREIELTIRPFPIH